MYPELPCNLDDCYFQRCFHTVTVNDTGAMHNMGCIDSQVYLLITLLFVLGRTGCMLETRQRVTAPSLI